MINTNLIEWETYESPDLGTTELRMRYPFNGGWHETRKRITRWEMLNIRFNFLRHMEQEMINEIDARVAGPIYEWDAIGNLTP